MYGQLFKEATMEPCISMIEKMLAISCEEIKAIEAKDIYGAEELFQKRENIMKQLGNIEITDKVLFFEKLQEVQRNQVALIEISRKLRGEYVTMLQRSNKEITRSSAYKKISAQALYQ